MEILDLSSKLAELEEEAIRMKDDIHFGNLCRQDVTSLEELIEMLDQLKLPWEKREHSVAHDGCDPIFLQRGLWEFVTCEEPFKRGSKEGGWEVKQWAVRTRPDSRLLIITEEVLPEDPHFYGWPLIITRIEEDRVTAAVARTKALMPEYWQKTLVQRAGLSSEAVGSSYSGLTPAELEEKILTADWESYSHPAVMAGCTAFKASIHGQLGVMELRFLTPDTPVTLDDRKGTGKVSAVVSGVQAKDVDFTVLILGEEQGEEVVFTFHPGDPIRPSQVQANPGMHGRVISISEAIGLGLEMAKLS